jgi:hypothetical protein
VIESVSGPTETVVRITAAGAVFGDQNRGFSVVSSQPGFAGVANGITVSSEEAVTVAGNRLHNQRATAIRVERGAQHIVWQNEIAVSALGLYVGGRSTTVHGNVVAGGNVAVELAETGHVVESNVFVGVSGPAIIAAGELHILRFNSILGTQFSSSGIDVFSATLGIHENNIYGNTGCGIRNDSGGLVDATNNFWGASTGPGPAPADEICDVAGGLTITAPFASAPFAISTK